MGKHKPSPIGSLQGKKLIPFGWYGRKFSHSGWLIHPLPEYRRCCEPFAGFMAILLNRKPSLVEIRNDLSGEAVNFYRVLRDEKEKLIEAVSFKPEDFSALAKITAPKNKQEFESIAH